jgi:ubiquinone/menaquinone biosynthesis C-methylase UbiE
VSIDADLYDAKYFVQRDYGLDVKRQAMYRQEVLRVWDHFGGAGSVLDVGCGIGEFLMQFDDRWTRYGYDPSEFAASKAGAKGITMYRNLNSIDAESMDVVIFRGVLQHMDTPIEDLVQATRILRKGGWLVILATPDADSLVYKIWGNLPALDAPRNWIVFGTRMLRNIVQRLNYEDIEIIHPYLGSPYANPVKDIYHFAVSLLFGWRKFAFPGSQFELYGRKV